MDVESKNCRARSRCVARRPVLL